MTGHRRDQCSCGATKDARSQRCRQCAKRPDFTNLTMDAAYAYIAAETARLEADLWQSVFTHRKVANV